MSYNAKCDKECTTMPGPRLHKHFMTNLLAHKQAGQICYKTIMYHSKKKNQSKITFITLLLPS